MGFICYLSLLYFILSFYEIRISMPYFITLYIEPMKPKLDKIPVSIPHAFLGLTKGKSPNELDKTDETLRQEYLKNKEWDKIDFQWYKQIYPSILDNDFKDEGFFGFAPVESAPSHWGKVFENNQYTPQWNENTKHYDYILRDKDTFREYNRCVFEVSQEQYEVLLNEIKKEVEKTKDRNPNLQKDDSKMVSLETLKENLYYNSMSNFLNSTPLHNCTTWVLHKLDSIGIEVIDLKEWMPDIMPNPNLTYQISKYFLKQVFDIEFNLINTLKDSLQDLAYYHLVLNKFQSIDKDLESIKGTKAFRKWARGMIDNRFACALEPNYNRLSKYDIKCSSQEEGFIATLTEWKEKLQHKREQLRYVYTMLDKILSSQIKKANNLQGSFTFISYSKKTKKMQLSNKQSNYESYDENELDPNIPANNWSLNQLSPYILIPKDKTISRILYHKYDYGKISDSYIEAINQSYLGILSDNDNLVYWSKALHKLRKSVNQVVKEIENV